MSLQMLRLEMGGTKGGAGALTMQIALSRVQSVISLTERELCVGRRGGLQQQWMNCIKGQKWSG
jgi:hypothetical protein